jgi:mRNA interferase MazF
LSGRAASRTGQEKARLGTDRSAVQPASGLAVVCPLTSKRKPYPFALLVTVDQIEGAVLVDQLKSMDWAGRKAEFHSKADPRLVSKVRQYIIVLLALR